ncbi:MAG: hypothetical protein COB02_10540 [Candidatus Cloacimonadota bacterium]|nr:MAG: hypothetical protein COB02_10540 [Candidatus Cloacimonadota bacterium]
MAKFNRRQLFKLKLNDIVKCLHEEEVGNDNYLIRPPGAIGETEFLNKCERCHKCLEACEYDSISTLSASFGKLELTPILNPEFTACHLCSDFPCIKACPSGALQDSLKNISMATVEFNHENCLNSHGTLCDTCAMNCPHTVKAITMEGPFHKRLPVLNDNQCLGCGLCIYYCDEPNAITIKKTRQFIL